SRPCDTSRVLFPLRVEDAEVDRMPWVSIGIAGLCLLVFAATWVAPAHPEGVDPEQREEIILYYEQHPYLTLNDAFVSEFLHPKAKEIVDQLHKELPREVDELTRDDEQRHLDGLVEEYTAQAHGSTLRRLSLVPARGAAQPGWLTHMFLHFGWLHILGNL